jgi:hypothetical protein
VQRRDLDRPLASPALLLALVGCVALTGCSVLIDDRNVQCRTDGDCAAFGGHPLCSRGVCVASGLGPADCFYGTPQTASEFANACTTAKCLPFDNCNKLNKCSSDPMIRSMLQPPAVTGKVKALSTPQPRPTIRCQDAGPNVIYVTGSTNFPPLLKAVAPLLAARNPPWTAVFQPQSSCLGAATMFDADRSKRVIKDIPDNWAFFFDQQGDRHYCFLRPEGDTVDVGESDLYPRTCGYEPMQGIADYLGPILSFTFVVPAASSEYSISAEAAHLVFGAGGNNGMLPPWNDPKLFFVRSPGTGTIQLASRAIGVPPNNWWGFDWLSSENVLESMQGIDPASAEGAIGVLSSDFADQGRGSLRQLYFQAAGQTCGYLTDSNPASFDKANVRDGHYPIWGPIHLFAPTVNGVPSPAADALVTRFAVPKLDQKLLEAIVAGGYIPNCAMRVKRDQEMGPVVAYQPTFGCGCYYDHLVNGRSSCIPCNGPGDCPSNRPACNYGFCEVQ